VPLPTIDAIIEHLGERSAAGKTTRLSARTAALIEQTLRAYLSERTAAGDQELIFRVDRWEPDGSGMQPLAFLADLTVARGAYRAFCLLFPFDRLTLRHGALVMEQQPWTDRFALDPETRAKVAAWRMRNRPIGGYRDGWTDDDAEHWSRAPSVDTTTQLLEGPKPVEDEQ
jgi:hypothetical protein